jgi:FkbM family methyltransferase
VRWQEQLESTLAESVSSARVRERQAFDQVAGPRVQSIVLYGAGNLGRKVLAGLRRHDIEPIAFADANPSLEGKQIDGVPVFSRGAAALKFRREAVFVVCVWHPHRARGIQDIIGHLSRMGIERVTSFVPVFWKFADEFLPYYLWDLPSKLLAQGTAIRQACLLLEEDSRGQFASQVRFRSQADFSCLPSPSSGRAYFPEELFDLRKDECFVDCGAFDGDTIRDFVVAAEGQFRRIVAFEPDPINFRALRSSVDTHGPLKDRITVYQAAVGASVRKVHIVATGQGSSAIGDGDVEVACETLDNVLWDDTPSFIKMDIEGFEPEALAGGKGTLERSRPVLAVCAYHRQDHLWTIPLLLHDLQPQSRLNLRMYWRDGFDLVCFSVPPSRVPAAGRIAA